MKLFTYNRLTEFTISDDHSHLLDVANDETKRRKKKRIKRIVNANTQSHFMSTQSHTFIRSYINRTNDSDRDGDGVTLH